MTVAAKWIIREAKGAQPRHIGERLARYCRDVVVVERQNFELVKILQRRLLDASDLIVIQLKTSN